MICPWKQFKRVKLRSSLDSRGNDVAATVVNRVAGKSDYQSLKIKL